MICVVIKGPSLSLAKEQINSIISYADIVELRLDLFESFNIEEIKDLKESFDLPMIFTLRSTSQGGEYKRSEEERLVEIEKLISLKPAYIDLEYDIPKQFVEKIRKENRETKIILSFHDFNSTPANLINILSKLQETQADIYKISTMALSSVDSLRLLLLAKESKVSVIAIGMGEKGQITRILGPVFSVPFTYASIDDESKTAPGQIKAETLLDVYNYKRLSLTTKVYGLIGNPIAQSISDITHNIVMNKIKLNSIYVKILLQKEELPLFFSISKKLQIKGLSVTIPFKESSIEYLDKIESEAKNIGAVNTITNESGVLIGSNTDTIGALRAVEEKKVKIKDKKVVVIGAGGAAKAIAYEMKRQGAIVAIINRTQEKAQKLASELGCKSGGLELIKEMYSNGYDILINCTSSKMPIDQQYILPKVVVMDISIKPKNTLFLISAKEKECKIIYGYKMFIYQALEQFKTWFKEKIDPVEVLEIFEKTSNKLFSETE
jgi:3-dehydroquinate dehydratase/shikimate dehydrogenase